MGRPTRTGSATVAVLYGLHPPDPFTARVLEIGCGAGGNLIAMAAATPGIRALGFDLAAGPIADGQRAIAEIGLTNVELRHGDVRERDRPRRVRLHRRPRRLQLDPGGRARRAAGDDPRVPRAANGIAYVSYNAEPGGYFRRMLRDAGLWHARGVDPGDEIARALKAQELYKFLQQHRVTAADTYGALLGARGPAAGRRAALPARPRRPQPGLQRLLVRRLRRARGAARARVRRRGRPLRAAHRDAAVRGRARAVAAGRRRPDRVRELHRPADRAPLPPERAVSRGRRTGRCRAGARAGRTAALGRAAQRRAARGRAAGRRLRRAPHAQLPDARLRGAARAARTPTATSSPARCSTASGASGCCRTPARSHAGAEPSERPVASRARPLAGGARRGAHVARLHARSAWRNRPRGC